MIVLFSFFAFRFGMGSDTRTYVQNYEELTKNLFFSFVSDIKFPLFNLLQSLFKNIGFSFPQFLLTIQIFSLILIGYVIYHESADVLLSLSIVIGAGFAESYMTSMIRQMLCMAIFFFAFYKYLKNEEYLKYYITIIPLCFFHWVCYILLFIPIMYYYRKFFLTFKAVVLLFIFSIIGLVTITFGIDWILKFLPEYMSVQFSSKVVSFKLSGFLLRVVLLSLVSLLYYFSDKRKINDFDRFQVLLCYGAFLTYICFINYPVISRACDFIEIIHIIILPKLIVSLAKKNFKILFVSTMFLINFILLLADVKFNLEYWYYNKSIVNYPYVSLLNPNDAVNYYRFNKIPAFLE
ncbi:MAG: EpsG family protein [Bacilli bacterium]